MQTKKPLIDWIIHYCANGVDCDTCGEAERGYLDYACNAHTHGLDRYGHRDFQVIIALPPVEVGRILNTMGLRVQAGERFNPGDLIEGIYEDCSVRLDAFEETGRTVLRVVIPDKYNKFPEEPDCMDVYRLQKLPTDMLYRRSVAH